MRHSCSYEYFIGYMWLRHWAAACGLDAKKTSKDIAFRVIPPPQMVANMKASNMDGYCVGEPWNGLANKQDVGYTHIATQDICRDHPEKALVCNEKFMTERKDNLRKVMMAVMEASIWLDDMKNRAQAATAIGGDKYVTAPANVISGRLMGNYELGGGLGQKKFKDDYMLFRKGGEINLPRHAHAIRFMAQYVRFGYLPVASDYKAVADELILSDLYGEVAGEMKVKVPSDDMKPFTLVLEVWTRRQKSSANYLTSTRPRNGNGRKHSIRVTTKIRRTNSSVRLRITPDELAQLSEPEREGVYFSRDETRFTSRKTFRALIRALVKPPKIQRQLSRRRKVLKIVKTLDG